MANGIYGAMIELQSINYAFQKNSMSIFILNNITEEHFTTYKDHYNFLKEFNDKYHSMPSKETFQGKFNDNFEWIVVTDPEEYLVSKLREAKLYRDIIYDYKSLGELIKGEKTDVAVSQMATMVQKYFNQSQSKCVDLVDDVKLRYDSYIERMTNPSTSFVSTGLKELDDILGGWDMKNETALVCARTGLGKCLEKGTKILMADGTTKAVEDIVVGDKVQSLGRINNVLWLHNGVSGGWRIIPKLGEPFVVSDDHIMTFMHWVSKGKWELVDMKIEDYMAMSNHCRRDYELYCPEVEYPERDLPIPPYILGVWLGDGTSCRPEITTMDEEVKEAWQNYAHTMGMKVSVHKNNGTNKAMGYSIVQHQVVNCSPNKVMQLLSKCGVLNNKHIPIEYLTSSKEQRMELLAGIIDTDGYVKGNQVSLTFKHRALIEGVRQLALGLGMHVGKIYTKTVMGSPYYLINISGCTNQIPTRVPHKKIISTKCSETKPYNLTRFNVERVDKVEYYGFMCDGDSRYIMANGILTHNTWWAIYFAMQAAKTGLNVGYYSGEMEPELVGYRFDTFFGNLSNGSLTHGNQDVKFAYEKYTNSLPNTIKGHLYCITPDMFDGSVTVSKLRSFIEKYNLQMLVIDQFSLLDDEKRARTPREQAVNISKDLRTLQRLKKIPMIIAVQLNREESETGPSTRNISESDRIGQDATTVLFLERKGENLVISVGKSRSAKTGDKLTYAWNVNKGILRYIPTEKDARGGTGSETLESEYNDTEQSDSVF